ncbi:hypothetical protein [Hydrogenophaga taeniospiralis]|uniref:hypothetical protein n=1 Tax=Hydrogenophaga taeniospiralis TaxID=65656 RepID=UPI001CFB3455|nr:hypothetical protein [Hydrogenophaga taeniospiralis]UCU93996.1 hypothetical protein KI616_25215 [Hydrogenophaga taeniospiralis]
MSKKLITTAAATLLSLAASPAWAVNKCTQPDGSIAFQDAPCAASAKKSETVKTWDSNLSGRSRSAGWEFRRSADDMTGRTGCLVISPVTSPEPKGGEFKFIPVNLAISVEASGVTFGVRTSTDKDLFHNDIGGMGVKLDNLEFIPLDIKAGQHVVGSSKGPQIVDAMPASRTLRLRLRFWPYDTLHDTLPIDVGGFASAFAQAKRCAGIASN